MKIFGKKTSISPPQASNKPRVLFVSHEATRTGAPKIILNLLKHFQYLCDADCETILHEDGQILGDFKCYSKVHHLYLPRQRSTELQKRIRNIIHQRRKPRPTVALCNSMESRFVAEQLAVHGVPVVALLHELPCSYSDTDYRLIYEYATKIVFPVQAVRDASHQKLAIPFGKDLVLPQGLLDPEFGSGLDREASRRQIRMELNLPDDAYIVLGCGTLDLRKGIDHFAAIARKVLKKDKRDRPIHFVWVGDGPRWPHSAFYYVQIDLRNSGTAANVHFIGERENVEPYFVGSDMFLLTSRVDPFPCVVHEAMASGLPVMTFEESGGASDALSNGGGLVVPYADIELASSLICSLARNPSMADAMRYKSLDRVQTEFRFDQYAEDIISLAESIAGRKFPRRDSQQPDDPRSTIPIRQAA